MTLLNCRIRMLCGLQDYRTHERSRHKAPAWEICGTASTHKALQAVLLEGPICPEDGCEVKKTTGDFMT